MITTDDLADAILEELARARNGPPSPPARSSVPVVELPAPGAPEALLRAPDTWGARGAAPGGSADSPAPPFLQNAMPGRRFLSEYEIKRMLTPGSKVLTIPRGAILSPLAKDWLVLQGVRVDHQ